MILLRHALGIVRTLMFASVCLTAAGAAAATDFVTDSAARTEALDALRAAIGPHPRALAVKIAPAEVAIEAQDPRNPNHIDRWRFVARKVGPFTLTSTLGPEPMSLNLMDPDLEANLFDLDTVDVSVTDRLVVQSIRRAGLEDAAAVTRIEIGRRVSILPRPTAGDVRWTLHVRSPREQASVTADVHGTILGADLSGTRRAQTVNIFREPSLAAEAAAEFRDRVGSGSVLTVVTIGEKYIGFATNLRDKAWSEGSGIPANQVFSWRLGGLTSGIGKTALAIMHQGPPRAFAVEEVDWTILATLVSDSLKRADTPDVRVTDIKIEKSDARPGGAALVWQVDIRDGGGETTHVFADVKGTIFDVELPESRRPKPNWLAPRTMVETIAKVGAAFGADAQIASIVFDGRGARVTVQAPDADKPVTYQFNGHTFTRTLFSMPSETTGPRFTLADASRLSEATLETLEADALKRLAGGRKAFLESVHLGPQAFAAEGGARAMEIRIRDREVDSAQAQYGWIIFSFDGRVLDSSPL